MQDSEGSVDRHKFNIIMTVVLLFHQNKRSALFFSMWVNLLKITYLLQTYIHQHVCDFFLKLYVVRHGRLVMKAAETVVTEEKTTDKFFFIYASTPDVSNTSSHQSFS